MDPAPGTGTPCPGTRRRLPQTTDPQTTDPQTTGPFHAEQQQRVQERANQQTQWHLPHMPRPCTSGGGGVACGRTHREHRPNAARGRKQEAVWCLNPQEENPEWRDRVLLVQIAVPSRTDVPEYQVRPSLSAAGAQCSSTLRAAD